MNISCDKSILNNAVTGVCKAVTSKSALPVLEGILLKAEGFNLTLTGYDFELAIVTTIPVNVKKPGEIVIPAKLFADMVRKFICDEIDIIVDENNNVVVKGGITQYTLVGIDATEYPALPNPEVENTAVIPSEMLCEVINTSIYAVATDDKRPAHTGELFCFSENALRVVALDGFRLAILDRQIECSKDINIIIPQKTLLELVKLISEDETDIKISANRRFIMFSNNKYTVISRLIEGDFLDYNNVIPKEFSTKVIVNTKSFIDVIERASLIITERLKNPLRINFTDDNNIIVNCKTATVSVVDELNAEIIGDAVEVGFNNRYLLDALKNSGCENVVFEINGALSPVAIKPEEGDKFFFLVLPVRFKNN